MSLRSRHRCNDNARRSGLKLGYCQKIPRRFGAGVIFPEQINILHTAARKLRRGFRTEGKIPVRGDTAILDAGKQVVGRITSGGFGPSVGQPVAMGYIDRKYAETGNELWVEIRRRLHTIHVAELPFVKHRYYQT